MGTRNILLQIPLAIALAAVVATGLHVAAADHTVKSKGDTVNKNDEIDPNKGDPEEVAGNAKGLGGGKYELISPTFTPPGESSFAEFTGESTHVDIELDASGILPSRDIDTESSIQISATITLEDVTAFPLKGEGNLRGGGGTGGTGGGSHWSAMIAGKEAIVTLVPARDLVPAATGRGEVPNVPFNATLPEDLSGTGEANKVRVAYLVQMKEPLTTAATITINLTSGDTDRLTVQNATVSFSVPADVNEYYSNGNNGAEGGPYTDSGRTSILVGPSSAEDLSTSLDDGVELTVAVDEQSAVVGESTTAKLVLYRLAYMPTAATGAIEAYEDLEIAGETVDKSAWPNDGPGWGARSPSANDLAELTVEGAERWTALHGLNTLNQAGALTGNAVSLKLQRLGGASMNAYKNGGGVWILYNRTSANHKEMYMGLSAKDDRYSQGDPGPWLLADLPVHPTFPTIDIKLANATDTFLVNPTEPAQGRARVKTGNVANHANQFAWAWAGPVLAGGETWDIDQVTTGRIASGYTKYLVVAFPQGAFSGEAASQLEVTRSVDYDGLLVEPVQAALWDWASSLLEIGVDTAFLNWDGVIKGFIKLPFESSSQTDEVTSELGAAANLAAEFNPNSVKYLAQPGGAPQVLTGSEGTIQARPEQDPAHIKREVRNNWTVGFRNRFVNGSLPALEISSSTHYVYPVSADAGDNSWHVAVVTLASSGVRKNTERGYAECRVDVSETTIGASDDEFSILSFEHSN